MTIKPPWSMQPGKVWHVDTAQQQQMANAAAAQMQNPPLVMPNGLLGGGGMGYASLGPAPQHNQYNYMLPPTDPVERLIYNAITSSRGGASALAREIREQIDMFNLAAAWGLKLSKPVEKPPV